MKSQVIVKKFLSLALAVCVVFLVVSPAKIQAMPFKVEAHYAAPPAITTFNNAAVNYTVGTQPFSVAAGDFSSDGRLDLAVTNYGSNNVSILIADDPPVVAASSVTTPMNTRYTFAPANFSFTDMQNETATMLEVTTLPAAGILKLSNINVTAGQQIGGSAAQIVVQC